MSRFPLAVPIASCGPTLDHNKNVRESLQQNFWPSKNRKSAVTQGWNNYERRHKSQRDEPGNRELYCPVNRNSIAYLKPLSICWVFLVLASQRNTTPLLSLMIANVSPSLSQPIPVHILRKQEHNYMNTSRRHKWYLKSKHGWINVGHRVPRRYYHNLW